MDTIYLTNRKFNRMLLNILSIFVIVTMAFPATEGVYAQEPSPSVRAHPVWDSVDGWDWPQEATLHLTIEDPNTPTSPDLEMEMPGTVDPDLGSVWFDFAGLYDLKPGDEVSLSDGTTTRNLVVSTHEIAFVNLESDTVAGTAEPGTQVRLPVPAELFVTADENGNWLADFKQISVDLQPGLMMIAEVFDEDGDNSSFELEVPNPFLVAAISQNWMWANGFRPETTVTISVYETKDSPDPVLVFSRKSDASGNVNVEGWEHDWDLETGNYMVATDGMITDDLVMEHITLDVFDPDMDSISGTTTPDRQVSIGVGGESGEYWMDVVSDPITGAWSGEFASVFDITPDMWASGNVYDGDGDITAAHNSGPSGPPDFLLYNIYIFDPESGDVRRLTNLDLAGEYDPTWSPNGKKIAHDVVYPDGSHGIYITDVTTGETTDLAGAQDGGNDASWSPIGKWIAFDRRWYGQPNIYIVPATGGAQIEVRADAVHADWAPNGKRIVFQDYVEGSIGTIPIDGEKGVETLIASNGTEPAWSPDGNWIVYVFDGNLWKAPVNIHGKLLGDPIQVTTLNGWDVGSPTWSTDSQTIFFTTGMNADLDIWSVPAAGGEITWLNGAPVYGDYNPANARNSSKIAYAGASADGQAARLWIANFSYDVGTWAEGEHNYYFETTYSVPEPWSGTSNPITFNVTPDARPYNGYVLLRTFALRARVGSGCPAVDPVIHPEQNTRFSYGWQTDFPMTYAEAMDHFNSMVVKAHWDDGMSADLQHEEIFSLSSVDFGEIVCASTEAPPEPVLYIHYEYPDVVEGDYELGHSVQVTVFDSEWNTKATATVETMEMPHWGGAPGFRVEQWDGMEGPPDIQPGDVVRAVVDGGPLTVETRIGEITAVIDPDANSITGTINAPWAGDTVNVLCMPWGAPEGPSEKEATVTPDGVSQFTCSWDPSEWDIQPGESAGVAYWGADLHWIANAASNPWMMAFPAANQVFGYGWPVGSEVNLIINGEDLATATVQGAPWDANDVMAFFDFGGMHDLAAGDVVTLSGSGMERTHIVQNLAVTDVNMETSTVSGTADSDAAVHAWVHGFGQDVWLTAVDGMWAASFGSDEFQLQPGMCGRAEIRVEGNNSTNVDWCVPNPTIIAHPDQEWVEGWGFEEGAEVWLTIYDTSDVQLYQASAIATLPDWDPGNSNAFVRFNVDYDLKSGDHLWMTDNISTKDMIVTDLMPTGVDPGGQIVHGVAALNSEVTLEHQGEMWTVMADPDGNWSATLPTVARGSDVLASQADDDGDLTRIAFHIPNTRFTVWPGQNYLEGYEWPDGAEVLISVADKEACSTSAVAGFPEWDPSNTFFFLTFPDGCTIGAGDLITLSHGSLSFTHQVQELAIVDVNQDANTVSGTAAFDPEQYLLHTWIHGVDGSYMQLSTVDGGWFADFGAHEFDLQPGWAGRVEVVDQASNATAVEWYIPQPPRIVVQITDDWFRAENFTPNGQLTFWIYGAEGGELLRHPETTWQLDGSGYVTISMWELGDFIDLVPGHYLVVSDGTFTKQLALEAFTFDVFDTTNGHLAGTAPEPFERPVWVGVGFQDNAWTMDVTTDLSGNWSADFGTPVPADYQWVAAQIFDADGDASELRPASQIIFLRPRCGTTYTAQPNTTLEIRYGSWLAIGEELAIQNAEHLTVNLVIDGELISGVQQPVVPGSEIPCGASADAYGVFYITQVGPLSPGTHTASVTWIFDESVTDGHDADGDGEPDWYGPGEVATSEFTIVVP